MAPTGLLAGAKARILDVATATPPHSYSQTDVLDLYGITDPRIRSLFTNSAIERRNLTIPPADPATGGPRTETQGELLAKHRESGISMGVEALEACLKRLGASVDDVGYLMCVTSTGFLTPGFSARIIREMGLPRTCSRADIVGMGCNAGLNALTGVTGWASAHPGRLAIMLCVEACSAAYVFDDTMRSAVVNSLFGDGAAAVAVRADEQGGGAEGAVGSAGGEGPQILKFSSLLIPEALDAMRYDWDDAQGKFSFFLDRDVPYVVGANAEQVVDTLLAGTGVRRTDVAQWIVHSGGKKVIDSVMVNLGLTRHDLRHTVSVLRDHGNLSSGSFLFSYRRLLDEGVVRPGDYCVLMTMGPGSTIETALVRWDMDGCERQ
ncbi:3,5-dihydroxyphenylacetyl-CoA synthase DpgA [Streptomyces kanamyceticus]|uniref:Type III polyketide synthase n=1 Tax=Streptomyces kanamyceticus TaxID=1967 RepID=A0A5J6GT98_STRKN|nr:3,5-dihydroxyphenylacetyl-CoA synthase DpgA [Streptomyces kanamyceticus]QEU97235.1 type III polyketide synthase [Streptomyces kanamyceticus]